MKTKTNKGEWRLLRRGKVFYAHNTDTLKRESLKTRDKEEAREKLKALNAPTKDREHNEAMALVYLRNARRAGLDKTWGDVMNEACRQTHLKEPTVQRMTRAFAGKDFNAIRDKLLHETYGEDFLALIRLGKPSITNYLKGLQSFGLKLQWLMVPVLAGKVFKVPKLKDSRPITEEEHRKVLAAEANTERHAYYRMLWLIGSAQTDCANLKAENFDRKAKELNYTRQKTGEPCRLGIGPKLEALLAELPTSGPLFPTMMKIEEKYRASEFSRRCRGENVGIEGVTLHSYRYAWAVKAAEAGMEMRFAQSALGHRSKTVALAYAKKAVPLCPAFE